MKTDAIRLAVTQRVVENATYADRRDALSQDWIEWLQATFPQVVPVPVPNRLADPAPWCEALAIDAILLSNGEDWGVAPERDALERALLAHARTHRLPLLAVCRGLQVLNVMLGGALDGGIQDKFGHARPAVTHAVALSEPFGSGSIEVNSYHCMGVPAGGVAPGLRPFAISPDGIVEGIYHPAEPILAIQWHPERPSPSAEFDRRLIGRFLEAGNYWTEASS